MTTSTRPQMGDELRLPREISIRLSSREDGGLRICSDDLPGLILSSRDISAMLRDLPKAIAVLIENNGLRASTPTDKETVENDRKILWGVRAKAKCHHANRSALTENGQQYLREDVCLDAMARARSASVTDGTDTLQRCLRTIAGVSDDVLIADTDAKLTVGDLRAIIAATCKPDLQVRPDSVTDAEWRDQIIPGTLEAFTVRMKHVLDNKGSMIGLTDAQAEKLAHTLTGDAEWLMRALSHAPSPPQQDGSGLVEALSSAIEVANEAVEEWDKAANGAKAGKILMALAGHRRGYRADIDAIHLTLLEALASTPKAGGEKP